MFDLWFVIPSWIRATGGIALMVLGCYCSITTYRDYQHADAEARRTRRDRDPLIERNAQGAVRGGIAMTFVGVGMFALSGRSRAERNGYRSV